MRKNIIISAFTFITLCLASCDEGKIYPDNSIDTGRTATVTIHFKNLGAWPQRNSLSLATFGSDGSQATMSKRIFKPANEEEAVTVELNNIKEGTKEINIAIVGNGLNNVYTYYSYPINNDMDNIQIPELTIDVACYDRIQEQVFNQNCTACHGGNTPTAGLSLEAGKSYDMLYNRQASLSPEGKLYVSPGKPDESFLLEVLQEDILHYNHTDIFNSSGKREITSLLKAWIESGANND